MHDLPAEFGLPSDPVVVGGLPGSGTRVVATILDELGYHLGDELNGPLDNLWWNRLFKQPDWYYGLDGVDDDAYERRLRVFLAAMAGDIAPLVGRLDVVARAELNAVDAHPTHVGTGASMLAAAGYDPDRHRGWAWKEPHTTFQLPYLRRHLPEMRYVHLLRHGLDMAVKRRGEMPYETWDRHYDLDVDDDAPFPRRMLRFWIRANRDALAFAEKEMPGRHHVVRFEDLCDDPETGIDELLAFLEIDDVGVDELTHVVQRPSTIGRHADADPSQFDPDDLDALREMGFEPAWS